VRYVYAAAGIVIVLGGLAAVKFMQISSLIEAGEAMAAAGPPPEAVSTDVAKEQTWENEIAAVGTISAGRGVTVSVEVAGEVKAIRFESGQTVKAGQILLELDSGVERAELRQAVARRKLAQVQVDRTRRLVAENAVTQAQLDTDEAELESTRAAVAGLEAQIERKVVRAPFAGRLGIRQVNLGQYLNPGTMITDLQSDEAVHADFSLPQGDLARISVGLPVKLELQGNQAVDATISAIDPAVDPVTRSTRVRAVVAKVDATLSPGMFVTARVILPNAQKVVAVPVTAVVHASYGDSVFIVEDRKDGKEGKAARQQFVKLGRMRGDFVAVVEGVKPGQVVVVAGAFKLRNGAPVVVNDAIKPKPELTPRPENH
jgi:membrane fusion protein (multidrug efflux system)